MNIKNLRARCHVATDDKGESQLVAKVQFKGQWSDAAEVLQQLQSEMSKQQQVRANVGALEMALQVLTGGNPEQNAAALRAAMQSGDASQWYAVQVLSALNFIGGGAAL